MIDPVVFLAVVILGAVGLISLLLGLRHRLPLRIAVRNIRRARTRSILVVLGLLIGTAIVSGSLSVGDTIQTIDLHYTYIALGYTDEAIYGIGPTGGNLYFPSSVASSIVNASSGGPYVAGVTPEIVDVAQALDRATGVPQTNLNLVGADPSASRVLGSFTADNGTALAGPTGGQVYLDDLAAQALGAHVGDRITVFGVVPLTTTVQAIVQDDLRGGFLTAGLSGGTLFVDLATAQFLENESGQVNFLAVTNTGSQAGGVDHTAAVSTFLNATLAATPGTSLLAVHAVLQNSLARANSSASGVETIFLVFGLFSIVAGAMLIIGIFTMIAEERKGEMGMLRAIGLPRRSIVLSYYFEGLIYAVGSAFAGMLIGVAAGYLLLWAYASTTPIGVNVSVIINGFTITRSSLIISYLVGFLLTLATVIGASWRVSRLNIVRAIRDVPEPPPPLRTYTYLAYLGAVVGVLGALLFATTYQGTSDISYPILGGSMVLFGGALVAARFVKNRIAFSALGLGLILWTGVEPLHAALFGTSHTGGVFLTFVVGVLMVGGALILFVFNGADLARGLERLIGGRTGTTPVARIGLANPSRRAARTAITLAIFALVLFTIVVLATFSSTLTGNLENSITSESGGYTFFGFSAQPIPDLPGQVANNSSLSSVVSEAVPVVTGAARIVVPDDPQHPYLDNVYAAPLGGPPNSDFYTTNQFPFQSTLSGWSAATVMHELSTNASVAVVDGSYGASSQFSFSGAHPSVAVGATIRVLDPANRDSANLTVIGILQETILAGVWVNPTTATALGYHALNGYLFTVPSGASVNTASQRLKVAFFPYGLVLFQFSSVLAQTIAIISGDIGLLEVFIALGLAVGIAALGILALRAVAERRREIGMLRATGMTRMMILKAFLLEYTFITLLGAAIGGLLGLLVVYNLVIGPSGSSAGVTTLFVPWANLGLVMLVTGGLATLAVIGPSLRGARLPPAEAIRSRE